MIIEDLPAIMAVVDKCFFLYDRSLTADEMNHKAERNVVNGNFKVLREAVKKIFL